MFRVQTNRLPAQTLALLLVVQLQVLHILIEVWGDTIIRQGGLWPSAFLEQ